MAFQLFPEDVGPLRLDSEEAGLFEHFEEAVDENQLMFLCVASTDDSCSGNPSVPPRIRLRANNGFAVPVSKAPNVVSIADDHRDHVASASWSEEQAGVFLVVVSVDRLGCFWEVEIKNDDKSKRIFTWAIANTQEEAHQPFIDMPAEHDFGTLTAAFPQGVGFEVANRGSKALIIDEAEFDVNFGECFRSLGVDNEVIEPLNCGSISMVFDPANGDLVGGSPADDIFFAEIVVVHQAPNNQGIRIRVQVRCHDARMGR
jgi:hypothetical protein